MGIRLHAGILSMPLKNAIKELMQHKKLIVVFAMMSFLPRWACAQMLAVSTDVVHDALQMPSLGVELVTGERSTLGMQLYGGYHPWEQKAKAVVVQPEWRYFFSGRPMNREFVGIGGIASVYDITWKGKVYDGNSVGIGLTFGYVLAVSHRLNLDFHAGFGAIFYRRKEYFVGDFYDTDYSVAGVIKSNAHGYDLLPTKIGISLSYMLK